MANAERIYTHPARPEWGRGVVVEDRGNGLLIYWEDGQDRLIGKDFVVRLVASSLSGDEAQAFAGARRDKRDSRGGGARKASGKKAPVRPNVASLGEQLERFDKLFPGGFTGETFVKAERGTSEIAEGKVKKGELPKQRAIDEARALLSVEGLSDPDKAWESVSMLLAATNLVHPLEGAIPFRNLKPESRAAFARALSELLHGDGDYGARFDAFVAAIDLPPDAKGKPRRPSWPLSTLLPALYHPGDQVCVKPKLMQQQAQILGVRVDYETLPSAAVYAQFLETARLLRSRLVEEGQAPRDYVDVVAFITTTLGAAHVASDD